MPDPTRSRTADAAPDTDLTAGVSTDPGVPPAPPPDDPSAPPGYDLGEEIGKGGMGVVYRAHDRNLNREVAVKILQGQPGSSAASRFLEEAQITGQLQHPGVPPVYRVGVLADGRPFLAMKLIKGDTLDALLRRDGPGSTRWLGVFEGVCQAVGYAHAHGVIHRDLKPGNVMVGSFGEVQVMDWGLAKVLTPHSTGDRKVRSEGADDPADPNATVVKSGSMVQPFRVAGLTRAGTVMGTPAFMPPEQARGEVDRVDRRSDVFGLGAILSALLTGRPPYAGDTAPAVHQQAAEADLTGCFARLDASGVEPDLIALAKRCLSSEPDDRPADGTAVATAVAAFRAAANERARRAEVERGQVEVRAAEQGKRQRQFRWAAAVVGAVLLAGVVGTTVGLVQAREAKEAERRRADGERVAKDEAKQAGELEKQAKERAEKRLTQIERGVDVLAKTLSGINPREERNGGSPLYEQLAERASRAANELDAEAVGDPATVANLQTILGNTLRGLGRPQPSITLLEKARATRERDLGADHRLTLETLSGLALSYQDGGRPADAVALLERVRDAYTRTLGEDHLDTLVTTVSLAMAYHAAGQFARSISLAERTCESLARKLGADHSLTLNARSNLAATYSDAGRVREAIGLLRECHRVRERKLGPDHVETLTTLNNLALAYAKDARWGLAVAQGEKLRKSLEAKLGGSHPHTLATLNNLALAYSGQGDGAAAVKLLEQVRDAAVARFGHTHPEALLAQSNLAGLYADTGKPAEATAILERVRDEQVRQLGEEHPSTLATMSHLCTALRASGKSADALPLLKQIYDARVRKLGVDHPDTLVTLNNLATCYRDARQLPQAIKLHEEVRAVETERFGADHPKTLTTSHNLALAYNDLGRRDEAIELLRPVFDGRAEKLGVGHPDTTLAASHLTRLYAAAGRLRDAIPMLERVREHEVQTLGADHEYTLMTTNNLSGAYRAAGRLTDALPLIEQVYSAQKKRSGADHPATAVAANNLARTYRDVGDLSQALPLFEAAAAVMERLRFSHEHAADIVLATSRAYERAGRFEAAEGWRRKWVAFLKGRTGGASPDLTRELGALGENLIRQRKWGDAEGFLRECSAAREKKEPGAWTTFDTGRCSARRCRARRSSPTPNRSCSAATRA
jgi:tetratricopeptide (TPR) repeat protein/predicted Ser/Thr protein kinase